MIMVIAALHEKETAHRIGRGLLKKRLIACYNLSQVESVYWWKGEMLEENETLLLIKTKDKNFTKIEEYFMKPSGYEVPELIAIAPTRVNEPYLKWVDDEVK